MARKELAVGSVAEAYLALLAERGVEYLFANAGTDFAPLVEAFAKAARTACRCPGRSRSAYGHGRQAPGAPQPHLPRPMNPLSAVPSRSAWRRFAKCGVARDSGCSGDDSGITR
jgi:hypothetical protein